MPRGIHLIPILAATLIAFTAHAGSLAPRRGPVMAGAEGFPMAAILPLDSARPFP